MPAQRSTTPPRSQARQTATRGRRRFGNRDGAVLIMVALSIMALTAFAIIAIDLPILLTTKGQLQAAADAAALAGASGLLEGSRDLAVQRALDFASYNGAVEDNARRPVLISTDDVTFPSNEIIRVRTHRTGATGDALHTYFLRLIDLSRANRADVTATAEAQIFDVCSSQCLKPWAIPDRWQDTNGNSAYDPGEPYQTDVTGYRAPQDVGLSVTLKVGNQQQAISPGIFYPVDYPPLDYPGERPLTGGEWYRTWISECNPYTVGPGDRLQLEPGNKTGPTIQGVEALIAKDPGARWDSSEGTVEGSRFGLSPRVVLVPFFDPTLPPDSGRNWVRVVKVGAFFVEGMQGNDVTGRFMQITTAGPRCTGGGPGSGGAFIRGIALIE